MNNLIQIIAAICLVGVLFSANGQNLESYDWAEAKHLDMDKSLLTESQIFVLRKQMIEMNYDDKKDQLTTFFMNHFVIQVNDDKGLKDRKELEFPVVFGARELIEFKVRIIKKDGTMIEFKKSDAKEKPISQRPKGEEDDEEEEDQSDEEEEKTYEYYDLSVLQIGDQLEYFLVIKTRNASLAGNIFTYQSKIPIQHFDFELSSNKEFTFLFKSYNNAPAVVRDSTNKVRAVYKMTDKMVEGVKREKFSNYNANIRGFIYKLDGYELGKKRSIYTFEDFAKTIFTNYYAANKKDLAIIKKVMKASKMKTGKTDGEKVLLLENYLKSQFAIIDIPGLNHIFGIENMFKFNVISPDAASQIILKALELSKIEHDLVVTCDRFDYRFDKDFHSNYYFDNVLIYVKSEKKFLSPASQFFRMGIIPSVFTHNYALFISPITVGGVTSGIGKVKFIDAPDREFSKDEMEIIVNFASNLKSIDVEIIRTLTGYFAMNFQPQFDKLDAEQRVAYEEALVRHMDKDMDVAKLEFLNVSKTDILKNPFIVKAIGSSKALLSNNDDIITFKIGMLIGEQSNLYEDETRQLPIEHLFSRSFIRTLKITLPSGYKAENLEVLSKNFEVKNEKGKVAALFKSSYNLNGNMLTVTIEEWFEDIQLPANKYAEFRAVINASADFAKTEITLRK